MGAVAKTNWEVYDALKHGEKRGVYIFLVRAFMNAPTYAGEAKRFDRRFERGGRAHRSLFAGGHRTFLRRAFFEGCENRSHSGFAARWDHYTRQDDVEKERLIWVATDAYNKEMGQDGTAYWRDEITLLVSLHNEACKAVEARVQNDIMSYYDGLAGQKLTYKLGQNARHARLVGFGQGGASLPDVHYRLNGGNVMEAVPFFAQLAALSGPGAAPARR